MKGGCWCGIQKFIAVNTKDYHWTAPCATPHPPNQLQGAGIA